MTNNSKERGTSKYTFVVEYEKGKEPAVGGATKILGGRLMSVAFKDISNNQLTAKEAAVLSDFIGSEEDEFFWCCDSYGIDTDDIIEKLRGMVLGASND